MRIFLGKLNMKHLLIFSLFFVFGNLILNAQSKTTRKDIVILKENNVLSERDNQNLSTYNFDQYRFLNLRKKIQLVNGPLIELLSLKEVQALGISVDTKTQENISKKSEQFKHESILQLNIGLGIYEAYEPK